MSTQDFLERMKEIQFNLLEFIDTEDNNERNFNNFITICEKHNIPNNLHELRLLLRLLLNISNNHYRGLFFYKKIEKILLIFKEKISLYYSNSELIDIFKSNKKILLFLIQKSMIQVDSYFVKTLTSDKYIKKQYPQYFASEIKLFMNELWFQKRKQYHLIEEITRNVPDDFEINRENGENEDLICQMIRNDSVVEFISYVNKHNYSLNSNISPSIYETNSFLLKNQNNDGLLTSIEYGPPTLIEYAAFFGSIQIFQYLKLNGVDLEPSLWAYAIHSNNPELIHLLEENHFELDENSCIRNVIEAIKCHGNAIGNYLLDNYMLKDSKYLYFFINAIKNYNFAYIQNDYIDHYYLYYFCRYDYYLLVQMLVKQGIYDINHVEIQI